MSVLAVVTRKTGAASLARLGYRIARALEEELVVLCLESGVESGEPVSERQVRVSTRLEVLADD